MLGFRLNGLFVRAPVRGEGSGFRPASAKRKEGRAMRDGSVRRMAVAFCILFSMAATTAWGATELAKQRAIGMGLSWLAAQRNEDGSWDEGDYQVPATASAVLAFVEAGYPPGDVDTADNPYATVVQAGVRFLFDSVKTLAQAGFDVNAGQTPSGDKLVEDYDGDGLLNDGGNGQAIYFGGPQDKRDAYTTGVTLPAVVALGNALGMDTVAAGTGVVAGMTYRQIVQDVVDWFSFAQSDRADWARGGWRYTINQDSDGSTAQWGGLAMLYGLAYGRVPRFVLDELNVWIDYIQNAEAGECFGGAGYQGPAEDVNMSKTGGLFIELRAVGADAADPRVRNALAFIDRHWNEEADGWDGNIGSPYAMWAVYKGLEVWGIETVPSAPGGFPVGDEGAPSASAPGDWYEHYVDWLVNDQSPDGGWDGYYRWTGPLTAGWYLNIINATPVIQPRDDPAPSGGCWRDEVLFKLGVSPSFQTVSSQGGTVAFEVSSRSPRSLYWTATSRASWLTLEGGGWGMDEGTVRVGCEPNAWGARTGTVAVVFDGREECPLEFRVEQGACGECRAGGAPSPDDGLWRIDPRCCPVFELVLKRDPGKTVEGSLYATLSTPAPPGLEDALWLYSPRVEPSLLPARDGSGLRPEAADHCFSRAEAGAEDLRFEISAAGLEGRTLAFETLYLEDGLEFAEENLVTIQRVEVAVGR